jgi:hypothetical protein
VLFLLLSSINDVLHQQIVYLAVYLIAMDSGRVWVGSALSRVNGKYKLNATQKEG